jgi:hypothetical protein
LGGEVEDKEVAVVFIILINKIDISKRREWHWEWMNMFYLNDFHFGSWQRWCLERVVFRVNDLPQSVNKQT